MRFDTPFLPKPLFFRKAKSSTAVASAPRAMQVRELSMLSEPTAVRGAPVCRAGGPQGRGRTGSSLGNLGWPEGLAAGIAGAVGEASSLNAWEQGRPGGGQQGSLPRTQGRTGQGGGRSGGYARQAGSGSR